MNYDAVLERERIKVENSTLPAENKVKIIEFIDDVSVGQARLSTGRRYAYILRLRKIAEIIPEQFLNPSAKDIKRVINTISQRKVKWGSGEAHDPSDNAIQAYSVTLKRYYKWLLEDDNKYPECVSWLKTTAGHKSREKKPDPNITPEEVNLLIGECRNARDKALISLLYDSGCRIGELLTMKIEDLEFDDYGAIISVTGKTGYRKVRVVGNSIAYIRGWLANHPKSNAISAWLFPDLTNFAHEMDYPSVRNLLKKAASRAGIERRIYPHLFRHTRATLLAAKIGEAPLEKHMGWVHGSKMSQVYVNLSGKDVDNAILGAYGVKLKETDKPLEEARPKKCPRCGTDNPSTAQRCGHCWLPLSTAEAIKQSEIIESAASKLLKLENVPDALKKLLQKPLSSDAKMEVITSIAELIVEPKERQND